MISTLDLAGSFDLHRERDQQDPLARQQISSKQMRELVQLVAQEIEVRVRSGNSAGKTHGGATLGVSLARGVRSVDGRTISEARAGVPRWELELPRIQVPNVGILIIDAYKQADESSIAAYKRILGAHPYKEIKNSLGGTIMFRVKPDRVQSMNPKDWSKILVFPRDGTIPRGLRAHWAHADETPPERMWREVRFRVIQGLPMYRWITDTPDDRDLWEWLAIERGIPADWRTELRLHVRDNEALTARDLERLMAMAASDPLGEARLSGKEMDIDTSSPWLAQADRLETWLNRAREPIAIEKIDVPREVDREDGNAGLELGIGHGHLFIWEHAVAGERYYIPADPSLGIADGHHDPDGLHVYAEGYRGPRRMVARYNGFLGGYGLGSLAAQVGERYADALVDPDMTGGWGGPVLTALSNYRSRRHPSGYGNLNKDLDPRQDRWKQPYGFTQDGLMKAEMIECVRWALLHDLIDVPSAKTIECLQNAAVDPKGRLVKPAGVHYEDFTCLGRFAYRCFQFERQQEAETRRTKDEMFRQEVGMPRARPRGPALYPWGRS